MIINLTFLFIALNLQDIRVHVHNLFSKSIPFTFFFDFIFRRVHTLAIQKSGPPESSEPPKVLIAEGC